VPALISLAVGAGSDARRRLVVGWTLSAWLQIVLPGLYWQHYYLLPTPGVAIAVAVAMADAIAASRRSRSPREDDRGGAGIGAMRPRSLRRRAVAFVAAGGLGLAIAATLWLQVRFYLAVAPQELTARYKGGRQWIVLREMGRHLGRVAGLGPEARLYVWGWQSPLYFYSGLDSPTRHFFVDNLLRDQADRDHPLIGPRVAEIIATLRRRPPELILGGYPPFQALRAFLLGQYQPSQRAPGLWIRRDLYGRVETAFSSTTDR
jgi:hypothetical protein